MRKFPIWLVIVFIFSLIPLAVYLDWYNPSDSEALLEGLIASPLVLLVLSLEHPLLLVSVVLMLIIHVYFLGKLVYGLFHKFNVKMRKSAKYVIPSMLGTSLLTFAIAMNQMKH
ncbi:MAG: hypothetical protein J6X85_00360 [Ruminococcus sp.]|nr:hypothetical protein [Ruminococcus sp.]